MSEVAEGYITRKELAKKLGDRLRGRPFSEWTLIQWEREKRGPPITRIGKSVVYRMEAVDRWLASKETGARR